MTDKELIKQEIERRIELLEPLECEYNKGSIDAYKGILQFINSFSEEPKKQPKFKVGDIIKGPHNNIFEIKEVLENQYVLHSKNGDELNSITIVDRSSCVVEEPASEDLDKLVISLEETIGTSPHSREVIKEYLQKAAEWGRTHFEDKSEMVSEDLEEAAEIYYEQDCPYEGEARVINNEHDVWFPSQAIEDAFVAGAKWKSYQMHSNCTESVDLQTMMNMRFEDGRIAGMEEMKQQMIKDAVEAFVNTYENTDDSNYVEFVTEQSPYKFKEAEKCKIIIIKEDNNEQGCREKN